MSAHCNLMVVPSFKKKRWVKITKYEPQWDVSVTHQSSECLKYLKKICLSWHDKCVSIFAIFNINVNYGHLTDHIKDISSVIFLIGWYVSLGSLELCIFTDAISIFLKPEIMHWYGSDLQYLLHLPLWLLHDIKHHIVFNNSNIGFLVSRPLLADLGSTAFSWQWFISTLRLNMITLNNFISYY